ncbi:MAG: aminopeptidase P family protein [Sporichthyaceae bacterium]|nr:aminopeptidase P family protein [Sporichthyaceae bacterium]
MAEIHAARRERLRTLLAAQDLDAALVTRLVNVRYLTGLASSNAALLVTGKGDVLAIDGRYATVAGEQAGDVELVVEREVACALAERAAKDRIRRLGFESHEVTVDLHKKLVETAEGVQWISAGTLVESLRVVKDEEEITLLREACAISDRALAELTDGLVLGRTERQIAQELERRMIDHGADGIAFETIVAAGPNSASPHHVPTSRRVEAGDFLKVDFGALYRGYHADETRTFVVGREPANWQVEIYDLVFAAQKAGREALVSGADIRDVDRAARSVIEEAGYGEQFPHGLGHGVGLEIHEAPLMGYNQTGKLAARTPVTVEPGIYLPGRGGVRIEDTLVVRDATDGRPELLTMTTKELLVLD